ncbi:MAG: protein DpdG [Rhodanobacter sp.]
MSLLNITNDGLPNVLVTLVATLQRAKKPLTRVDLLARIAPDGITDDDGKMARQTLNRWLELGFFEEVGEFVRLVQPLESAVNDEVALLKAVRMAARTCALSEANNPDLWANREAKAADFTRSLAWLLAQDVYHFSFGAIEELEKAQIADNDLRLMQNSTRRNGLKFWSHFLGFVREPGGGEVDPTCAIRESLNRCIVGGGGMPAADFIQNLAVELPVLDGGRWRRAVEDKLEPQALPVLAEGQLSLTLSRALIQFIMEGLLIFENRADVGRSIVLTGRDGLRPDYRFSWVRLREPTRRKSA